MDRYYKRNGKPYKNMLDWAKDYEKPELKTMNHRGKPKIKRIKAINPKTGRYYTWSAYMLMWKELPLWLLKEIKRELPDYRIEF